MRGSIVASSLLILLGAVGPSSADSGSQPQIAQACDPTFGGKYHGLIRRLRIAEDEGQYGPCRDYGAWQGNSYKGHTNLPPNAFWTYSAPYWYVWAGQGGVTRPAGCDPAMGGKYSGLLRQLRIPEDASQYGTCRDYGAWAGNSYKGHTDLPSGAFWTYSAPYWFVWANRH